MMFVATKALVLGMGLLVGVGAIAQPAGVPFAVGVTAPLSGATAPYGQGLLSGIRLAAARANAAGGIGGRPIEVVVLDDAGDPQRAKANAEQLIAQGVVALTGVHGARPSVAVADVLAGQAEGARPPLVGPATSTEMLRDPPRPGVFHIRAGLVEEVGAALLHLDTIGLTRYAVLAQADPLGRSGREQIELELSRIGIRPTKIEQLAAGSSAAEVQKSMARLCADKPEAIVLALGADTASQALGQARTMSCAGQYVVFSEAGAALAAAGPVDPGQPQRTGLLVTQVVPHPNNHGHPLVAEYRRALAQQAGATASYPSLEGYFAMRVLQEALKGCLRDAVRACLTSALEKKTFDVASVQVRFGPEHRLPRPFVEITLLDRDGRFKR